MLKRTVLSILAVLVVSLPMLFTAGPIASAAQTSDRRAIEVIAKRYAFEPANIEVIAGESIRLLVKSGDGLHGFQVKELKIAKDIPRGGKAVTIDFTAPAAGSYPILCSTYCGDGHGDMKGTLTVTARASAP